MDHIAILRKSWKLTNKILSGEKKIESRWYLHKVNPRGSININDTIYFKDSGDLVRVKAEVDGVKRFSDLNVGKIKKILQEYGRNIGLEAKQIPLYLEMFKDKKYCILIFLKNACTVEAFDVDKTGFGKMSAWITVSDINKIKK